MYHYSGSLQIEIGLIYRKDKYMCAATREFIEQLQITVRSFQN